MMRRILLFCLTLISLNLVAQIPANDDCGGIIDLGLGPSCDSTIYNNVDATASQIFDPPSSDNIPSCWDNVNNDVWFQFTVPADGSILDFTIILGGIDDNGNAMTQPQIAVYRGDCLDNELDELLCAKADVGESELELDLLGLTPGLPYFLRVDAFSASATPNWGDFIVCVDTLHQVNTIDQGGSTSCSGELYDTGGPDEDYSDGENNVFTICPPAPNNTCITYTLEYFNVELGSDEINIYDGDGTNGTLLSSLTGSVFDDGDSFGGVCFQTQASSGCITIEFVSDGSSVFEGFASSWECSTQPCEPLEGIQVDGSITADQIAEIVATPATVVTVDTIICPDGSFGTFTADNTDLGLGKGLLLTSGSITNAVGPNNQGGTTGNNGAPGDDDLDIISVNYGTGQLSNNACVVEIDVFVAGDELSFEYIFGSEEYPEYVSTTGGGFNDIFAFLVSGPGITGDPLLNNQLNIATLPGSNTLVEINSVNHALNWEYYRDNENGQSVEYDGLTSDFMGIKKSLTARVDVDPCNTYHLKLAVADRGDTAFDSGVFISEISGGRPQAALNSELDIDYLIEGCSGNDETITLFIGEAQTDTTRFTVTIGGTAIQGTDYITSITSGDIIEILPGQTEIVFPIVPLIDNLDEGTETIQIVLTNNFGCGEVVYFDEIILIEDEPQVDINLGQDTAVVCANNGITLNVEGATTYFWTPVSIIDAPTSSTPFATPVSDSWVNVVGQVGPCTSEDSIFLQIIDPQVSINPLTATDICEGDMISLQAVNNVNSQGIVWTPDGTISNPNAPVIVDSPTTTTTYTASVVLEGCQVDASITINVDPFDFPDLTTTDTTLCESFQFDAAAPIPGTTTTFLWTPNVNMNNNTLPNPTITGTAGSETYTLVATSANGFCSETATVDVTGIPASAPINNPDTIEICLGEMVSLSANTSTAGAGFQWISDPFDPTLAPVTDTILTVTPEISTIYITELIVGACTVYDSIYVRVDSLPDLTVEQVPFKEIYCKDDIVSLVSPTYEPSDFPDIMHQWNAANSIVSDLENLNLVMVMDETTTYTRITVNRACSETTQLTLEVIDPMLELTWMDTTICPGEQVSIMELLGEDNFSWTPVDGIIAGGETTNNPTFSPASTETYTVTATISDCEAMASATVNVAPQPQATLVAEPSGSVPIGTVVKFTASGGAPGDTYIWTYNGNVIGSDSSTAFINIIELGGGDQNIVRVTIINGNDCEDFNQLGIAGTKPFYEAPNIFTPNGDGVNDFFNFTFPGQTEGEFGPIEFVRFSVWNRWGNMVYNNENPTTGWDGTHDGKPAPSDVYIFLIQIKLPNGDIIDVKSSIDVTDPNSGDNEVTLIR